jgi:hypothetical protein
MLSNLSKEKTETKIGVAASWFHEKCDLRLDFGTVPKSMKIPSTIHISFAVISCPHPLGNIFHLEFLIAVHGD